MIRKFIALIFLQFCLAQDIVATTYLWNNCSLPVYAYPYDLEKQDIVIRKISDQWILDYMKKTKVERSKVESKLVGMPNLDVDVSLLSEDEVKGLAKQAFIHLNAKNKLGALPNYPDSPPKDLIEKVRLLIVMDLYREAGDEIKREKTIKANYSPHYFSLCEYDYDLIDLIANRTLENIENGKFVDKSLTSLGKGTH